MPRRTPRSIRNMRIELEWISHKKVNKSQFQSTKRLAREILISNTSKNDSIKFFDVFQEKGLSTQTFQFMSRRTPLNIRNSRALFEWTAQKKSTSNNFSQEIIEDIDTARLAAMAARHQIHSKFLNILRSSKKKFPEKNESKQYQKEPPVVSGTYEQYQDFQRKKSTKRKHFCQQNIQHQ